MRWLLGQRDPISVALAGRFLLAFILSLCSCFVVYIYRRIGAEFFDQALVFPATGMREHRLLGVPSFDSLFIHERESALAVGVADSADGYVQLGAGAPIARPTPSRRALDNECSVAHDLSAHPAVPQSVGYGTSGPLDGFDVDLCRGDVEVLVSRWVHIANVDIGGSGCGFPVIFIADRGASLDFRSNP